MYNIVIYKLLRIIYMFYTLGNSIAVVKPNQPVLDWLKTIFSDIDLSLDKIRLDVNSYLLPEVEEIEDGINIIDEKYDEIFYLELSSWTEDEELWPKDLSLEMFWQWFDVEIIPTIIDICEPTDSINEINTPTLH